MNEAKDGFFRRRGKATAQYAGQIVGFKQIKETTNWIVQMGKVAFIPEHKRRAVRTETFQEAQTRLGVSDEHITLVCRNYTASFYIAFMFALACGFGATYYGTSGVLIGMLSMMSILTVCLANCFKFSFRVFQIKKRSLCSVKEWYAEKNQWFPH